MGGLLDLPKIFFINAKPIPKAPRNRNAIAPKKIKNVKVNIANINIKGGKNDGNLPL